MISIRPHKPSDSNFIFTSWVNSYRPFCRWMPKRTYQRAYSRAIESSLADQANITMIAYWGDTEDVIQGWVHGSPGVLHYLFVRPDFRDVPAHPVASMLTEAIDTKDELLYTHWTFDFRNRLRDNYIYRPDCFRPKFLPKEDK